ncbi:ABC transporter ATP-binding protein [Proteinivorax hydrogeniformans]|uniref:ABC transporter ATP-binding protein n=2 Tax=Proteinivorax hydrogeniformans TaxID=1826727 RepID=A0AAU8HXA1_9FIRM
MGGGRFAGAMSPSEKPKDFKGTLLRLTSYLKPKKVQLIIVLVMSILSTAFMIVSPKIMGLATTRLFDGVMERVQGNPEAAIDFDYIFNILLALVGLYIFSFIFGFAKQYIMADVAQKTVYQMRKEVKGKLSKLPLKFFDSKSHGEILSRVTNDVDTISQTLQQSLTQLITAVVTLVGILVMMIVISPLMTLVCLFILPASFYVTKKITTRSRKYFAGQQKKLGELNGHVEEMFTGHKIVKAFGREKEAIEQFEDVNDKLYDSAWKAQFMSGLLMPLMTFINNIGYVIVCVAGGVFVTSGMLPIGDVQALIQYSKQFTQPISQTASIANILQSTIAAAERVFELLDESEEPKEDVNAVQIPNPKGEVSFEKVEFGYKKDEVLFDDMNIQVKQGETIAIVGPTGAGKTTLVNLLMRFYDINSGKITVDGHDIQQLKRGDLRKIFGMVLQDTWLFNGTIRDNIAYGRLDATEEDIIQAAKAAHADHFIRTLPDGYDTVLNEEASNISQGQKQLITIARAVLADPTILILDEATSSVDTRTEEIIQKAMSQLMKGRTSFVIAHRLSTIRNADMILVMKEGKVIEKGTHQELMDQESFYRGLYNSQFTGSELVSRAG